MNPAFPDLLMSDIQWQGPLPFDQFMEKALYHPTAGFYASGQARTGKRGDFLTPVSPGPVLGQLLARQAGELHQILGRPKKLRLIEQGADSGSLARDLFDAIRREDPQLAAAAEFHLLEPVPRLAERQKKTLREAGEQIRWHSSWQTVPADGAPCFFYSCELVDSFPVKMLEFQGGEWREKWVVPEGPRLAWQGREVEPETQLQIQRWNPPEVEGYTLELRPGVGSWVQSWAEKISCGMVLTLDYGFPSAQLFSPARSAGTLVAIRNHQRVQNPLDDPGQLDLTAHVNFTEIEELGTGYGFQNYGLTDFARGLTALATPLLKDGKGLSESWIRNFRHLTHPSFFGQSHQILLQGKSLPPSFIPSIVGKI